MVDNSTPTSRFRQGSPEWGVDPLGELDHTDRIQGPGLPIRGPNIVRHVRPGDEVAGMAGTPT